jgi:hypothetical protein
MAATSPPSQMPKNHRRRFRYSAHATKCDVSLMARSSLTAKAQARGTNQREPRSGTGPAIPRCLQRIVRRHGHFLIFAMPVSAYSSYARPASCTGKVWFGLSRAAPNCFNEVKYFWACAASPFETASYPASRTRAANCFKCASCVCIA